LLHPFSGLSDIEPALAMPAVNGLPSQANEIAARQNFEFFRKFVIPSRRNEIRLRR
jgi:hypothetical protein